MGERELTLDGQNPLNLYGVNNDNLKVIRDYFPKLKIVARGNQVKAIGSERDLSKFIKKTRGNMFRDHGLGNGVIKMLIPMGFYLVRPLFSLVSKVGAPAPGMGSLIWKFNQF